MDYTKCGNGKILFISTWKLKWVVRIVLRWGKNSLWSSIQRYHRSNEIIKLEKFNKEKKGWEFSHIPILVQIFQNFFLRQSEYVLLFWGWKKIYRGLRFYLYKMKFMKKVRMIWPTYWNFENFFSTFFLFFFFGFFFFFTTVVGKYSITSTHMYNTFQPNNKQ